jgi:hypothetical protein
MTILTHLEVKVIAGGATGIPCTGVEDTVPAEATRTTRRIQARDRSALGVVKDSVRNRDHESLRRTDNVDAGVRMLPWCIAITLAHVQFWTIHRGSDDDVRQRATR